MDAPDERATTAHQEEQGSATALVFGVAVLFGIGNFLAIALLQGAFTDVAAVAVFLAFAWCGVIAAQGAVHAIWCVLAPVAGRIRLVVAVAVALFWYGALFLGIALVAGVEDEFWDVALIGVLCLPLISLGIQAPLWLMRFWLRWRIVRGDGDVAGARMTTLRIRHIMLGTAWIALALGATRLAKPENVDAEPAFLLAMLIPALVLMLISGGTTLPLLLATLRARSLRVSLSIVIGVFLASIILCFLSSSLLRLNRWFSGRRPPGSWGACSAATWLACSAFCSSRGVSAFACNGAGGRPPGWLSRNRKKKRLRRKPSAL
jgi:hypothetical protein